MRLNFHKGQWAAWESFARFILVLAGTQSGKTSFGPHWLYREIQMCGPGDYMAVTPTYPLLEMKALPEFRRVFEYMLNLGTYVGSPIRRFVFSEEAEIRTFGAKQKMPTNVYFGYAADPDSLESATVKAVWADEAGQKRFKLGSYEALLRRLSLSMGRILFTTTPYDLGWLKQQLWDKWKSSDPDIDVIRFDSTENPAFPQAEFERARRDLPRWKFDLFYRAIFTRPAGLIYDSFNEDQCKIKRFAIPDDWPRYMGIDFGGVNTAALFYAEEPKTKKLYLYREYKTGGRTAKDHAEALLKGEPMIPFTVGGSHSEDQWRKEFRAGGLPIREPDVKDVEVGIDRVYGAHARNEIVVFDDLSGYLEEKMTYSRKLDANGEATEEIEDKSTFHRMDAERYIIGFLKKPQTKKATPARSHSYQSY